MHFDLTDLRLFAAVVEEGSITVGASRAGISLPSASARMKGMEARMARLWMIFVAGMIVLAILAAVMIAMLLHVQHSLHGS